MFVTSVMILVTERPDNQEENGKCDQKFHFFNLFRKQKPSSKQTIELSNKNLDIYSFLRNCYFCTSEKIINQVSYFFNSCFFLNSNQVREHFIPCKMYGTTQLNFSGLAKVFDISYKIIIQVIWQVMLK